MEASFCDLAAAGEPGLAPLDEGLAPLAEGGAFLSAWQKIISPQAEQRTDLPARASLTTIRFPQPHLTFICPPVWEMRGKYNGRGWGVQKVWGDETGGEFGMTKGSAIKCVRGENFSARETISTEPPPNPPPEYRGREKRMLNIVQMCGGRTRWRVGGVKCAID